MSWLLRSIGPQEGVEVVVLGMIQKEEYYVCDVYGNAGGGDAEDEPAGFRLGRERGG